MSISPASDSSAMLPPGPGSMVRLWCHNAAMTGSRRAEECGRAGRAGSFGQPCPDGIAQEGFHAVVDVFDLPGVGVAVPDDRAETVHESAQPGGGGGGGLGSGGPIESQCGLCGDGLEKRRSSDGNVRGTSKLAATVPTTRSPTRMGNAAVAWVPDKSSAYRSG
jgi:hypothetical protein